MNKTIVQRLADITLETRFEALPDVVVQECKRILLDSIACAVASAGFTKGRIGVEYGRILGAGGTTDTATIMGTGDRVSVFGAAFANGELINTLDMDCITPPGHVATYVLPGALAVGEAAASSGRKLIEALAISHEMTYRFGRAMDGLRDHKDGKVVPPKVFGYSSAIFGATAAIGLLKDFPADVLANSLGIAGCISPVNSQVAWFQHAPTTTIKYTAAGVVTLLALTAAYMAQLGHRGDLMVLDDAEYGYRRFINTIKWEPAQILAGLGEEWNFPALTSYKPYPHCRSTNSTLDCVIKIVESNDIHPSEIDAITVYLEGYMDQPVWMNRQIEQTHDAQFSVAHGVAVAAHRLPPGIGWLDSDFIHSPSVMDLMKKVTTKLNPEYLTLLSGHPASRPAKVELQARGRLFTAESRFPKGSPSPEPESFMTNEELIQKFRSNAEGVLSSSAIDGIVEAVMGLEKVSDVGSLMRMTGEVVAAKRARAPQALATAT